MSRMIAWVVPRAEAAPAVVGDAAFERFLASSALHSDGWGFVGRGADDSALTLAAGIDDAMASLRVEGGVPRSSAIAYLRFASPGAAVARENLQPFVADDVAFAHNGALVPRSAAFDALPELEREMLQGTTDSEVYFAHVRHELAAGGSPAVAIARATARLRGLYPDACLNAFLLIADELVVVHAPGVVPPPHAAFAARGWALDALPPGHDEGYNDLWTEVLPSGARAVATNGTLGPGASLLPRDAVVTFAAGEDPSVLRIPLAGVDSPSVIA